MRIDVKQAETETYDLCIVGTGPAGIMLALEYQKLQPQHPVLLIEYQPDGAPLRNHLDDTIKVAGEKNHHLPYECTNKGLGGTSASWGGRCVMYDEIDFLPREILKGECTWNPELFHDSLAFADKAAQYFETGDARFNLNEIPGLAGTRIAEHFQPGGVTDFVIERWSMPTRFGQRYRQDLESSKTLHLLSGWEVFSFSEPANDGTIQKIQIRSFDRARKTSITAKKIILAAGTQESTRLLLKNQQIYKLRNGAPASLGKYYQGHVSGKIATVHFYGDPKKTDYGFLRTDNGVYLRRRFQLSKQALLENNLLNTALWLDNPLYVDPAHRNGAMSFMYLAMITPGLGKRLAPPAIAQAITKGKKTAIGRHLWNIVKDLPESLYTPASIFVRRYCIRRKLPGVFLYSPKNSYALHFHAEQVPAPENRMELAADGDTLVIHYKYMDEDIDSVIRTHAFLDEWLKKCNCGELKYWFAKDELPAAIRAMSKDGVHQVGTTRIASTPEKGVVDENLQVWGTANLYVCSSSVFPTSGQANPTFLLGAFAIRLAHHLALTRNEPTH